MAEPEFLVDATVEFPPGSGVNSALDVDFAATAAGSVEVLVTNPLSVPVGVHVKQADPRDQEDGGNDHFPEVLLFQSMPETLDPEPTAVEADFSQGGRVTLVLGGQLASSHGFDASVRVRAV